MRRSTNGTKKSGGFGLLMMIVTMLIIIVLVLMMNKYYSGGIPDGQGGTSSAKGLIDKARAVAKQAGNRSGALQEVEENIRK